MAQTVINTLWGTPKILSVDGPSMLLAFGLLPPPEFGLPSLTLTRLIPTK